MAPMRRGFGPARRLEPVLAIGTLGQVRLQRIGLGIVQGRVQQRVQLRFSETPVHDAVSTGFSGAVPSRVAYTRSRSRQTSGPCPEVWRLRLRQPVCAPL